MNKQKYPKSIEKAVRSDAKNRQNTTNNLAFERSQPLAIDTKNPEVVKALRHLGARF